MKNNTVAKIVLLPYYMQSNTYYMPNTITIVILIIIPKVLVNSF